jgi:hypothetical protein
MNQFDPELFNRLRERWRLREGPLVDLKAEIYHVVGDITSLAEFIRDMIAFANTARRRGESAYILFGVDDNGHILLRGIKGQCTRVSLPADWDDDDPAKFERQQDLISRDLHAQVEQYVRPGINFDYIPGVVNGVLVSYVAIRPELVPQPFEVKRGLPDRRTGNMLLVRGQCWKREGESKYEIPENEKTFLYRWTDVPYISKVQWIQHLGILAGAFTDEPSTYLDLAVQDSAGSTSLDQRVAQFLALDTERVLFIVGRPGAGKTRYLYRLVHSLAEIAGQNLETASSEQPQTPVPVFVNLSGYAVETGKPFKRKVALCLDSDGIFGFNQAVEPEKILADRSLRLVICLDAFDEIEPGVRNVRAVGDFLEEFPNLKTVVTTRPNAPSLTWLDRFTTANIASMSERDVFSYLAADLKRPEMAYEFIRQDAELFEVACVPLVLKYVKEYWQEYEQQISKEAGEISLPSLGELADRLFHRMLEREYGEKELTQTRKLDVVRQMESLSALALWLDGRFYLASMEEVRRYLRLKDITRLQNLGVIQLEMDGLRFFNELTQAYFVAIALRRALSRGRTQRVLDQITTNRTFWQRCLDILHGLPLLADLDPLFQRISTLET